MIAVRWGKHENESVCLASGVSGRLRFLGQETGCSRRRAVPRSVSAFRTREGYAQTTLEFKISLVRPITPHTELSQATSARDALDTMIPTPILTALGFPTELKQDK
jgi:hypothetical protein